MGRVGQAVDGRGGSPLHRAAGLPHGDSRRGPGRAGARTHGPSLPRFLPGRPGRVPHDPLDGVVYTTLQELATRISHHNTGRFTGDPLIEKLTARIAVDENLHYIFYRELGKAAVELDPSAMVLAMHRQVTGFAMPGRELPDFREKASQIAEAGIYDLRIHHDDVLLTILFRHWKLDQLTGLTEEAEQARESILMYLRRLDATAKKYEEKRAAADIA